MLTDQPFIHGRRPASPDALPIIHWDSRNRRSKLGQGVSNLTATAREIQQGQYLVRIIFSMAPNTFLYSHDQPFSMKDLATRIELDACNGFVCREDGAELAKRFIHLDGAVGLRPYQEDKVTFIRIVQRSNTLCDISGKIYYRTFSEHNIFHACEESFRIRLK